MPDETKTATLADGIPGHSVMEELLRSQAVTGPRGSVARQHEAPPRPASVGRPAHVHGLRPEAALPSQLRARDHARHQETEPSAACRLAVVPVIAVVDAKSISIKERPVTVVVLNARSLVRWLRKRPVVLDAGQVASILALAKLPSTWHSSPAEPTDAVTLARRFDALHREVLQARTRRLIWAGVFVAVLVAAMLALAPQIGHLVTEFLSSLTPGG